MLRLLGKGRTRCPSHIRLAPCRGLLGLEWASQGPEQGCSGYGGRAAHGLAGLECGRGTVCRDLPPLKHRELLPPDGGTQAKTARKDQ